MVSWSPAPWSPGPLYLGLLVPAPCTGQVCKSTREPEWQEEVDLLVKEGGSNQLRMEVMDRDTMGKVRMIMVSFTHVLFLQDESMGWTTVDVRRASKNTRLDNVGAQ